MICDFKKKLAAKNIVSVSTVDISQVITAENTSHNTLPAETSSVTSAVIMPSNTSPATLQGELIITNVNIDGLAVDNIPDIHNVHGDILLHGIDETFNDPSVVEKIEFIKGNKGAKNPRNLYSRMFFLFVCL